MANNLKDFSNWPALRPKVAGPDAVTKIASDHGIDPYDLKVCIDEYKYLESRPVVTNTFKKKRYNQIKESLDDIARHRHDLDMDIASHKRAVTLFESTDVITDPDILGDLYLAIHNAPDDVPGIVEQIREMVVRYVPIRDAKSGPRSGNKYLLLDQLYRLHPDPEIDTWPGDKVTPFHQFCLDVMTHLESTTSGAVLESLKKLKKIFKNRKLDIR